MTTRHLHRNRHRVANETFTDVVVAALRQRLREVAAADDVSLDDVLGPPASLGTRVAATVPAPSQLAAAIGPVYRQASLATALGHSRQAVSDLIKRRRLLALTTQDGHVVIPAFQLGDDLRPLPGMAELLQIITPEIVDEWTFASWLNAPNDQLEGASVVGYLAAGNPPGRALAVAEAARTRWSV